MSGIREADIPDVKHIAELGVELLESSIYKDIKPDLSKFKTIVANLIVSNQGYVLVVVDDNDKPQGYFVGMLTDLYYSKDRFASDLSFYIRKEYRHFAPRVIKKFIAWVKTKPRVAYTALALASGSDDSNRSGLMYEKIGLSNVGGIYYLEN